MGFIMKMSKEKLREIILSNHEDIQDLKLNSKDVEVFNYIKEPKNAEQITDQFNEIKYGTVKSIIRKLQEKGYITYNKSTKKYEHKTNLDNEIIELSDLDLMKARLYQEDKFKKANLGYMQALVCLKLDKYMTVQEVSKATTYTIETVRSAIKRLKKSGYVIHDKNKGTYKRVF